ncbi:hypothetical protein [Bacteroides acidifaciens]|uniref:hypothetical protein n=1 Tax=Bacteroides acidifaciens TaxID=85831 RepID=UPI003014462D
MLFIPLFGSSFCLNRLGFTDALQGLANKLFPTLFPENYSFAERKNFTGNALQSDGIKRGSPNLRLENQPATAGMGRISDNREIIEKERWLSGIKWGCYNREKIGL